MKQTYDISFITHLLKNIHVSYFSIRSYEPFIWQDSQYDDYVSFQVAPSPATGSKATHTKEVKALIADALEINN